MKAPAFPRQIDGISMTCPELTRASGLTRYDIIKAFEANPAITTMAALKAAVVARKSRPARSKPTPKRTSLLWNGMDRLRNRYQKT